jgi:hypothetical protein
MSPQFLTRQGFNFILQDQASKAKVVAGEQIDKVKAEIA